MPAAVCSGCSIAQHINFAKKRRSYVWNTTAVCPGAAIMYAIFAMERPQTEIYRDYTHLTDFARLMAAYAFYTQHTGEKVTEIKIDTVPTSLRIARYMSQGDLIITDEMKQIILEAVNYAFDHPHEVPSK